MFLRSGNVSGAELTSNLVSDILILARARVTAFRHESWWLIASDVDWTATDENISIDHLFRRIVPFPQAGPNSMHSEILLTAFAEDVLTWGSDGRQVFKGQALPSDSIWQVMSNEEAWQRVVAFHLGGEQVCTNY